MAKKSYWEWIKDEAAAVGSDGCTGVSDWHIECCWEHDLACHYNKNPRSAYEIYMAREGHRVEAMNPWSYAEDMTRRQADYAFADCNLDWSATKKGKLRSIVRFIGARIGAFLGIGVRKPKTER